MVKPPLQRGIRQRPAINDNSDIEPDQAASEAYVLGKNLGTLSYIRKIRR